MYERILKSEARPCFINRIIRPYLCAVNAVKKKTFFASDFHLGVEARLSSSERERKICRWLDHVATEAEAIYLVGDLFDFWFEYQTVVPKGFNRLLGKLAELSDAGVPITAFTGNHDLWMFGYFEQELGIPVFKEPIVREIGGKTFFIGHGDGLGPGDKGYKRMKKVFQAPASQMLFRWLHPDLGTKLASFSSQQSRRAAPPAERAWLGEKHEWLLQYCLRKTEQGICPDYFIFGHRHLPIDWLLPNGKSRYINLGEWLYHCSYAVFDGTDAQVLFYENPDGQAVRNPKPSIQHSV
jgi:UDP-2,3-diacylglucosamine hydrolase